MKTLQRLRAPTTAAAVTVFAAFAASPASAVAATWSVSPQGADGNTGSAQAPFRTIARAATVARSGDTVVVASGRYPESVELSSRQTGVVFRGVGQLRPVLDGGGSRPFGFRINGADRVTIEGFEISGQAVAGVFSSGSGNTISNNVIHHVGAAGELQSNGVRVSRGSSNRVVGNTIHHIGPGSQAMGIWLLQTRGAEVARNSIYLVRKEGVRDWQGLDNSIVGNRVFLNWVGISLNTSTGSSVTGNYAYDNVEGIVAKHLSYRSVLSYWGLGAGRWSRVSNNTVQRSTEAGLWIGQSGEPLDYLDVRGNTFSGAGTAFVRDSPTLRGPNVIVDGNAYSDEGGKPRWVYKDGWSSQPGLTQWPEVRTRVGWETNGGPLGGVPGAQLGTALAPQPAQWTPHRMDAIASSSPGTWQTRTHLRETADNDWSTYWMTETGQREWVIYDFGGRRTFNHLILTVYSHDDPRNVRGYKFEVSDDRRTWRTVLAGTNADPSGAAAPYELPAATTARYLRFTMVDTFCQSYAPRAGCGPNFVLSDLKAGLLSEEGGQSGTPRHSPAPAPARLAVAGRAVLTRGGSLRIGVSCLGRARRGRGTVTIGGLGRTTMKVAPRCRRSAAVPVRRASLKRFRTGATGAVRVSVRAPGWRGSTRVVEIRR